MIMISKATIRNTSMLVKAVNLVAAFLIPSQIIFFHLSFACNQAILTVFTHEGCEKAIGFFMENIMWGDVSHEVFLLVTHE